MAKRERQSNITLSLYGWSNQCMHSLLSLGLHMADGTGQVLALPNVSEKRHTGATAARAHLVVLTHCSTYLEIDNAANMVAARQLLLATPGFG